MNNFKNYYGSKKFSDVSIQLADQLLPAHKIILVANGGGVFYKMLDNQCKESANGVIKFQHDDSSVMTAIKYLYGIRPQLNSAKEWVKLMKFAHFADLQSLVNEIGIVPPDVSIGDLRELALTTNHGPWMIEFVDRVAIDGSVPIDISYIDYVKIREIWKARGHSHYWLFHLDCNYFQELSDNSTNNTRVIEYLNSVIPTIDFSQFSSQELESCAKFPIIEDIPMLSHLLSVMQKARPLSCFPTHDEKLVDPYMIRKNYDIIDAMNMRRIPINDTNPMF
jgi:hypothetical protein